MKLKNKTEMSNEFVEVNEKLCGEVHNCMGTKECDGKIYCRGCGNVQPKKRDC